ncbi:DUF2314 domain-containing protein [Chryseobacterium balustinum]|uniref:Uncharacterized conserved protein YegJ, DUF2314 family n=1 Tax=Chryseobacterium balustinum TaxID=246 RepID=A0ABY1LFF1_9FLAO|nr:DUF2314 domain-containing protein [Chryseobacterium balustinum]AZB30324.1 DUF2314 domain-containing protein [Chryseobacterium balustinum]AZB30332.1 DUF2314 domain-containing protein [Chryseobacterium balustinum]SKC15510.1 Uncharacterized conserved protein YegJ, DUF2314 family [Chryseobacterium balustinum]
MEINENYLYSLYKAKNTFWYFIEQIENNAVLSYTAVKFKNENDIYVWLENIEYKNNFFEGVLSENNEHKSIPSASVIDWMIVKGDRLIGGYTIRHYRDSLPEDEKVNFDIDFGLRIDDGNDFFYPDLSTPEGALITLENFYTQKSLDGVLSCKDFHEEAKNVLLGAEMDLKEELINETAELLKLAFIENLQKYGMPNFENAERVFNRIVYNEKENTALIEEKLIYSDGNNINKFWVSENEKKEWKVLNLVE